MIHLHVHSHYSLLDGIITIPQLVKKTKELNMPAIALTDHGSIAGWIEFQIECDKAGIKPIFGIEAYCCTDITSKDTYHITLLAKNNDGLKEIIQLHNIGALKQFYRKPRITYDQILDCDNIIVLSGCLGSFLSQQLLKQNFDQADQWIYKFRDRFKDDFYLEIQDLGLPELQEIRAKLYRYNTIKQVVTNDVHYLNKEDALTHHLFMAGQFHKTGNELERMPDDMWLIKESKLSTDTTYAIADKCNAKITKYKHTLPSPPKPIFISERLTQDRKQRVRNEYDIIKEANYFDYFCIVADYLKWAREHNIMVGPARGSVGGSELAYSMGIHDIDPQKYNLYFSRFYNKGRKDSMPDIDNDFPPSGIEKVKEYIMSKYHIAGIATYGSMDIKGAIKFAARVLDIPYNQADELSKKFSIYTKDNLPTNGYDSITNKCLYYAKQYIGLFNQFGQHASGYIITDININNEIPLRFSNKNEIQTCWDMNHLEWLGFIKFDLLKIKTLDIIQECIEYGAKIKYDDPKTYQLISSGDNTGVFQLYGSTGISELATQIKPKSIEDIATILAIYRPGPLQNNVHTEYVACRNGKQPTYLHQFLKPLLKDTYSLIIYQEDVIRICIAIGFSETEADTIRKMMGKKKPELLKDIEPDFIKKCSNITGISIAKQLWNEICNCSGYLFNKSHAIGYATLTYITAYLKTNYPLEFYTALLNNENKPQKIQEIISDTDINILPPRYDKSKMEFTIEGDSIRYGLKGVYGIGEKDAEKIISNGIQLLSKNNKLTQTLIKGGFFDSINTNRQELLNATRTKRRRSLTKIKDFSSIEKQKFEFEMLHVFLTDNPLKSYDVISYNGNTLKDNIDILAIIQDITISKNKKGNQFAKIDIININNQTSRLFIFSNDMDNIKLEKYEHYLLRIKQYQDIFYISKAERL